MLTEKQLEQLKPYCVVSSNAKQEEDEQAWLAARTRGIGGSDVGAICGVNNWSSARQIYFRKVNMFQDESSPSAAALERMHFGHVLEPVVAEEFVKRQNADGANIECIEADCSFSSVKYPYLLANVDRFVVDSNTGELIGILECKTANENMNSEWADGQIPQSYYLQVQHYLFVTGLQHAWISCLVGGNKFYTYDIFYDASMYESFVLPKLDHFWNVNVKTFTEPDPMPADCDFYDNLFTASSVTGDTVELNDTKFDTLGDEIMELKAQIKELEAQVKEKQAAIKNAIGDNLRGVSYRYEYTWAPRSRTSVDSNKLRQQYPDVYDDCIKVTEYRQLGIKKVVEDD